MELGHPMGYLMQSSACSSKDLIAKKVYFPSLSVDNDSFENFTLIKVSWVEFVDGQEVLLKLVKILGDFNLVINEAYITYKEKFYTDVDFHVTDSSGSKLRDDDTIHHLKQELELVIFRKPSVANQTTCIELVAADRPGLLSEISSVLKDFCCNVVQAHVWTHNGIAAAIFHITDVVSGATIEDRGRIIIIQRLLDSILRISGGRVISCAAISGRSCHAERDLHRMMATEFPPEAIGDVGFRVFLTDYAEYNISVITLKCPDRPKLLFDMLCGIIDMGLIILNGTMLTVEKDSFQEYHVRHKSGRLITSTMERWHAESAIMTALHRRGCGVEIEVLAEDRCGLLSDVTGILMKNINIRKAEILTWKGKAELRFLVGDASGKKVKDDDIVAIEKEVKKVGGITTILVRGRKVVKPIMKLNFSVSIFSKTFSFSFLCSSNSA